MRYRRSRDIYGKRGKVLYDTVKTGMRIRDLRNKSGLTQEKLAEKVDMHVKTLSKAERGVCSLSIDHLIDIAVYFSVTMDYLVLGVEMKNDKEVLNIFEKFNCSEDSKRKILQITKAVTEILYGA